MKAKELLYSVYMAALTSAWWAFAVWPDVCKSGVDSGVGILILPALLLSVGALIRIGVWVVENWDD